MAFDGECFSQLVDNACCVIEAVRYGWRDCRIDLKAAGWRFGDKGGGRLVAERSANRGMSLLKIGKCQSLQTITPPVTLARYALQTRSCTQHELLPPLVRQTTLTATIWVDCATGRQGHDKIRVSLCANTDQRLRSSCAHPSH